MGGECSAGRPSARGLLHQGITGLHAAACRGERPQARAPRRGAGPRLARGRLRGSLRSPRRMDPYGLRRVVSPPGALPQRADILDPTLPLGEDEVSIAVEALNVDAASFRQLEAAADGDPDRIAEEILRIVRARGKLHNPVTGSGGILVGRVSAVGPLHPAAGSLRPGERIATLVSLTLTPLRLERIRAVRTEVEQVACEGEAILFATGPWARLPEDLPEGIAFAALDVCGAPAFAARLVRPGMRVLVVGGGPAGALVLERAAGSGARAVGRSAGAALGAA